ncbi:MAG: rod-binding protein [Pirellulaceae bacterium]|nr:rod-binding protein [Pirellulaceae bacterium]
MNTQSWIPTRATALPVQYLAELNRLSTATAAAPTGNQLGDPQFVNRLQLPTSGLGTADNKPALTANSKTSETAKSHSQELNLLDSLRGLSPSALKFEQRPTSFEYNSHEIASEKLESVPESAEQAMQQFVGETFYGMLMKQMRNTVVQSDLFGNSSAKRMFESQLDQTLVQELSANHSEFLSRPIRI